VDVRVYAAASWVKVASGSCSFQTDTCTFPTEKKWMFKISISALNILKMGFSAPNFAFLDENFPTAQNLGGEGAIAFPLPGCHCVYLSVIDEVYLQ